MSFKFFSKPTSPSHPAPVGIAVGLPPKPLTQGPLEAPESKTRTTELDTLSVFPSEESASASGRALSTESRQAASRYVPAVDARDTRAASQMDKERLDDFRRLLGQTQIVLERLKGDASGLRVDLSELRSVGAHLGQGYAGLGEICRLTEKRSALTVEALDAIEKRIEPLEVVRELSATTADKLASLNQLVEAVMQCGARFEAQKAAIDQGREEAARVSQLMEGVHARVISLTEKREWLGQAEETVGRLEHRAIETTARLERCVNEFDAQNGAIERALVEAMRVTAILKALEGRVAALTVSDRALEHAEAAIGQLERRANDAKVRLEQVVRGKSVGRPLLRWATVLGALGAVGLLGIVALRTRDQPNQIAGTRLTAHQDSPVAAPVSLLPSKVSRLAMFVMPAARVAATTGTTAANEVSAVDRPHPARTTRTAQTAGASRLASSANETVQYVGSLTVESEPTRSAVFVDRQQVGETPLQLTRLRAGSHVVRIERDGYDRWTTAVLVAADKQTRVSAKLQAVRDR